MGLPKDTLRLHVMSDLHMEIDPDAKRAFVDSLNPKDSDVLVLAGDITNLSGMERALAQFCSRWPQVVYVLGNHEYWHEHPQTVDAVVNRMERCFDNVRILNRAGTVLGGHRIHGATLWYPNSVLASCMKAGYPDFRLIGQADPWIFEENERSRKYLQDSVLEGDVVITHFLPSYKSVAERYLNMPNNCFFVSSEERVIYEQRPLLWIHGHTHESCNYEIADTTVICNPYGHRGENPNFDPELFIDL